MRADHSMYRSGFRLNKSPAYSIVHLYFTVTFDVTHTRHSLGGLPSVVLRRRTCGLQEITQSFSLRRGMTAGFLSSSGFFWAVSLSEEYLLK